MAEERARQYKSAERGARKTLVGKVVSTRMAKTIAVEIERTEKHAKYEKYIRRHTKVYAHDEKGEASEGDVVRIVEGRATSKLKRFHLVGVVQKATAGGEVSA